MFEYLAGELTRKSPTEVVVECAGVGYCVHISLNTFTALPERGSVRLYVHPHYAENNQRLFGFADEEERTLFRLLHGVRGIGPVLALSLLSHEPVAALVQRLRAGDVSGLTRVKGVGRKTAERLLVELRDRLEVALPAVSATPDQEHPLRQALESLGLTPAEAGTRARQVLAEAGAETELGELLRQALQAGSRSASRG